MGKPWFRVKRFGYGAGMPVSWEGWVVLAVFLAIAVGYYQAANHLYEHNRYRSLSAEEAARVLQPPAAAPKPQQHPRPVFRSKHNDLSRASFRTSETAGVQWTYTAPQE